MIPPVLRSLPMNATGVDFYEFASHRDYVAEHCRAQAKLDPDHWRVNCCLVDSERDLAKFTIAGSSAPVVEVAHTAVFPQ
jgi:hypothetical protein